MCTIYNKVGYESVYSINVTSPHTPALRIRGIAVLVGPGVVVGKEDLKVPNRTLDFESSPVHLGLRFWGPVDVHLVDGLVPGFARCAQGVLRGSEIHVDTRIQIIRSCYILDVHISKKRKKTRGIRNTNLSKQTNTKTHAADLPGVCRTQRNALPGLGMLGPRAGGVDPICKTEGRHTRRAHCRRRGLRVCLIFIKHRTKPTTVVGETKRSLILYVYHVCQSRRSLHLQCIKDTPL